MYKSEFVRKVGKQTRLSQSIVQDVLNASHRLIEETLRSGGTVQFPGFGTFYTRERKASKLKDMKSGKEITVEARNIAAFKTGDILRRAVAGKRRR